VYIHVSATGGGQNQNIKIGYKALERVEQFRYLGRALINQNSINEEIKSRLVHGMRATILFRIFCLPVFDQKNKDKIYTTVIFPLVLCRCETWSLALREEQRLRVLKNRVLRKTLGPRWSGEDYIMKSFMICTPYQILLG
jgi:hypothetical protein